MIPAEATSAAPGLPEEATPGEERLVLEGRAGMLRATRKLILLVLVAVLLLVVGNLTALSHYLRDVQSLRRDVDETGVPLSVLVPVATAVLVALGSPRLVFSGAGGFLLGFWKGFALSYLGSLAGSFVTFIFARSLGREWVALRLERRARWRALVDEPTVSTVFWIRQLPITCFITNSLLGVTGVRHGVFLVGSALGFLPGAAIVTLLGSGIAESSSTLSFLKVGLALAGTGVLALGVWRFRRRGSRVVAPP